LASPIARRDDAPAPRGRARPRDRPEGIITHSPADAPGQRSSHAAERSSPDSHSPPTAASATTTMVMMVFLDMSASDQSPGGRTTRGADEPSGRRPTHRVEQEAELDGIDPLPELLHLPPQLAELLRVRLHLLLESHAGSCREGKRPLTVRRGTGERPCCCGLGATVTKKPGRLAAPGSGDTARR